MCSFQENVCLKPLEQWFPDCLVILNRSFLWIFQPVHQIRLNQSGQLHLQSKLPVNQWTNLSIRLLIQSFVEKSSFLALSRDRCPISDPHQCSKYDLQQNMTYFLQMFQNTKHLIPPQQNKLLKLVSLSEKLAAWRLLPHICPWVVRTVEIGLRIHFAYHALCCCSMVSTTMKPEHLLTQVANSAGLRGHRTCSAPNQRVGLLHSVLPETFQKSW